MHDGGQRQKEHESDETNAQNGADRRAYGRKRCEQTETQMKSELR